jgi:uncharacterized protein (TIRG00374 family)
MTEPGHNHFRSKIVRMVKSVWFKVAIAAAVIYALFYFNRLDVDEFASLSQTWEWLAAAFLLMLPTYLIVSYRFHLILLSMGIETDFHSSMRWTMIGSFFDVAMPSSSGGDIVKAGYIVNHVGPGTRTNAVMAVVFDRVLGLLGLFLLAGISSLAGWTVIRSMPGSTEVLLFIFLMSFGSLFAFRLIGSRRLRNHPNFQLLLNKMPLGDKLFKLTSCFNELRERPKTLVIVLALSVLNHLFWCSALLCITMAFAQTVQIALAYTVFPLAIFSNVFGFAGGFGVGTAAFDVIFTSLLGIQIGAAIGLTFQSLSALSRLLGLPFYLASKDNHESHPKSAKARGTGE